MKGIEQIIASLQKKSEIYHEKKQQKEAVSKTSTEAVKSEAKKQIAPHYTIQGAELKNKTKDKYFKLYTRLLGRFPASTIMLYAYMENMAWAFKCKTGKNIASVDYKLVAEKTGLSYELIRKNIAILCNGKFITKLGRNKLTHYYLLRFNTKNEHFLKVPRSVAKACFRGRYNLFKQFLENYGVLNIDIKDGYVKVFDKYQNSRAEKLALPWLCKVFKIKKETLLLFLARMKKAGIITIQRFKRNRVITFLKNAKDLITGDNIRALIESELANQKMLC